jgi:hypothetical protein
MRPEDVTFKTVEALIEPLGDGAKTQTIEVCEISYPDGKVVAYPADMVSPETGKTYRETFADKYKAFKNGEGDPDRVAALEAEIEDRQNELKALKTAPKATDKHVQKRK